MAECVLRSAVFFVLLYTVLFSCYEVFIFIALVMAAVFSFIFGNNSFVSTWIRERYCVTQLDIHVILMLTSEMKVHKQGKKRVREFETGAKGMCAERQHFPSPRFAI